jgi:serine phosphatase RsbU (regulator of sigma subunit)
MKLFLKHSYLFILFINFFSSLAQDTIKINDSLYSYRELTISQYYYFDTAKSFNIKKLEQIKFQLERSIEYGSGRVSFRKVDTAILNYQGIPIDSSIKSVWLKYTLKNITNHQINYLVADTSVFGLMGNNIINLYNRFEKRENHLFGKVYKVCISLSPEESKTVVVLRKLRVYSNAADKFVIKLELYERIDALEEEINKKILYSVIFGATLILILYNLCVFLLLKRKIYLYYFFYIFLVLIPFIEEDFLNSIFIKYWAEKIFILDYLVPLSFGFYALFILQYFNDRNIKFLKFIRFYYKFIFISIPLIILINVLEIEVVWDLGDVLNLICFLLSLLVYVLILINAIIQLKRSYKPAIYILVGNLFVIIGTIISLYFLTQVSSWSNYSLLSYAFIFSVFLEALIFSIGITDQINMLQKEVEKEQKTSIETLENKVTERTIQLKQEKEKVEYQKQEILDSIEYAKRIQTAILPPPRIVKEFLKHSFVLYLPKDIVAGDFYWMESMDDKIYFAACDCTGHGVPGAMVSVVCNNALNRALNEFGERDPAKLFDKTRELVLENFAKSDEEVQDGMDASLAVLNVETKKMLWSGANNPLWIYRTKSNFIEEIKADKQPIGKGYENKPFTTHKVDLNEGDIIYLFTDGYSDQFGGDKGRKLTKSKFKDLLLNIANLPMEKQREELLSFHDKYRGIEEQVDDICVIGVRV